MRGLQKLLPTKSATYRLALTEPHYLKNSFRKVEEAGKKVVKPLHKSIHASIVLIIFLNSYFISDYLMGEEAYKPTRMLFYKRNTRPRWLLGPQSQIHIINMFSISL